jgi:hypothetical protein
MPARPFFATFFLTAVVACAASPEPKFHAEEIDRIALGNGVAIADVDGDKRPDIILADQRQFVWYRNPGPGPAGAKPLPATAWRKYLLAENLAKNDNICVAAQDIDGDGKCEIAVGTDWNPNDTVNSGAVFYLVPPPDRTKPWEAVKLLNIDPTPHRLRWLPLSEKEWSLLVVPLHGKGNKDNAGLGAKTRFYRFPADPRDLRKEWKHLSLDASMHLTHGVHLEPVPGSPFPGVLVGGKEGLVYLTPGKWERVALADAVPSVKAPQGVGEVRTLNVIGDKKKRHLITTVEPMNGNQLVVYHLPSEEGKTESVRQVLTDKMIHGHALACGDLLGIGSDQIVVGWSGNLPGDNVGIRLWTPTDAKAEQWKETIVDDNKMACEDLQLADLDGDGDLDIVACGRETKNLIIYWNETVK